jgi:hypothetical protein
MFKPKVAGDNPGATVIRVPTERWTRKSSVVEEPPQEELLQSEFYVIARSHSPGLELAALECVSPECDDKLLEQARNRGWIVLCWAAADKPLLRVTGPLEDAKVFKKLVAQQAPILDDPFHDKLAQKRILQAFVDLDRDPLD